MSGAESEDPEPSGDSPQPMGEIFDDIQSDENSGPSEGGEWWGLRNTEPSIPPQEVGQHLDLEAEWWQHLGTGFIKQSGAAGSEAWMHYTMAIVLLLVEIADLDEDSDDDEPRPGDVEAEFGHGVDPSEI